MTQEEARLYLAANEMLDVLYTVLPYLEELETDETYKAGVVSALTRRVRSTIEKAQGAPL